MDFSPVKYAALCLTHDCNLRCSYCYAGRKSGGVMAHETAHRAVDFLHEASGGSATVTFFGGEPLLELDLMRETVEYARERYARRIGFRMSTNGTLLSPDVIEFLRANEIFFVLSIDGAREQHDQCRRTADGHGSYTRVVRQLQGVFEFNPYTIAVSVVVPETAGLLAAGVRDLLARGFRYVLQTLDYSAPWERRHLNELKRQYHELARFYHDQVAAGEKIYYSPFDERIKTWAQKPYGLGDLCDLANSQIAIAPSGRIYPCVQFIGLDETGDREHAIGDVFGGFEAERRRYYVEENYADKEPCMACALRGRCATFCGCVNWRATGSLRRIPPVICEHERMLMPIVDRLANRLWRRKAPLFRRKFYEKTFPVSSYVEDCMQERS